jgi:ATP-dependent protease Clp ATPase subunit
MPTPPPLETCSFCGFTESGPARLLQGREVAICGKCAQIAVEVLAKADTATADQERRHKQPPRRHNPALVAACSLRGHLKEYQEQIGTELYDSCDCGTEVSPITR